MQSFSALSISDLDDFVFGRCRQPLRLRNGPLLGAGTVYPELNFTLPPMQINDGTISEIVRQYRLMAEGACLRAVALQVPGLVIEFELLPELTSRPEWGAEVTETLRHVLDGFADREGLASALRVTPNDLREFVRPPFLGHGEQWEQMVASFEACAAAGADLLSIESTGGKELHDDAILNGDVVTSAFSLGILACRDMVGLWDMIVAVAERHGIVPAGDTACGFANTAMALADTGHIPKVWAALLRVMTVPRSLVAYERGARGPGKDCAYENVYLKAITGYPMSMEGAEAACAHLSPVGNVARAVPDLWSNESVQNIKLLGGMAPTVSLEQLAYATRVFNQATAAGEARLLRDLYVEADAALDPQAYVLRPDVVLALAAVIVAEPTPYLRTRRAALEALGALRDAVARGKLTLSGPEQRWLDRLSEQADGLPEDEEQLVSSMLPVVDRAKVRPEEYGLRG